MKTNIYIVFLLAFLIAGCEKYEDFTNDYEYSIVYFAYQNPVRTVLTDDLTFKVGTVIGGKRANDVDQTVMFEIAPELLLDADIVGANTFTLLPSNYYTLSSTDNITISSGELVGFVDVILNKDLFLADTLSLENTYALPFLIKETSLDSILVGSEELGIPRKDYSIVVIKYQHRTHGEYYHRGNRVQYNADGTTIDTVINYVPLGGTRTEPNVAWEIHTLDANSLVTEGIAEFPKDGDTNTYALKITHPETDQIVVEAGENSAITGIIDNGSSYDSEDKVYYLNYEYTIDSIRSVMTDTLIMRDDQLRLELW